MSMDYLLVLCSVLLPLAAAVEGKIRVVVVRLFGFLERVREARFSLVAFVAWEWELGKQATPIPLTAGCLERTDGHRGLYPPSPHYPSLSPGLIFMSERTVYVNGLLAGFMQRFAAPRRGC